MFFKSLVISSNYSDFFFDIGKGYTQKRVQFLKNKAILIEHMTELLKWYIVGLTDVSIDLLEQVDNEFNSELFVLHKNQIKDC